MMGLAANYVFVASLALSWIIVNVILANQRLVSRNTTRKIVHIGTGPLFLMSWLTFPSFTSWTPFLLSLIPLTFSLFYASIGLGLVNGTLLIRTLCRSDDRTELVSGPLQYGLFHVFITSVLWISSPQGIVASAQLCGGDGIAPLFGQTKLGRSYPLPWNPKKTWIGSAAMFFGGYLLSLFLVLYFSADPLQYFIQRDEVLPIRITFRNYYFVSLIWISLATTIVESLPMSLQIDNLLVPFVSFAVGYLVL
eukprot:TRINITY_DN2577_c0_g1_i2.p1 TRINITY_DN2577_c0_g1~~TRINITY_DN2577_c0_g1_i2.p1  ORF type:complete len:251 (+),score=6.40 TRINITY_DN2577_c0_g1_i2:99-851(+)